MNIKIKGYIYHKMNESFLGCHDRYALNIDKLVFAISDGVSRSFFPDIWAELPVKEYVSSDNDENFKTNLSSLRKKWFERVKNEVEKPDQKWFVKNMFYNQEAAAATFVGLRFNRGNDGKYNTYNAQALGDSFLFFVAEQVDKIESDLNNIIALSSKNNFEFDNFPDYYISREGNNKGEEKKIKNENLENGTFYLMTDALAKWFYNYKDEAIEEINRWKDQHDFELSVEYLRKKGKLEDDDSAILIIEITNINTKEVNIEDSVTDIRNLIGEEPKQQQGEEPKQQQGEEPKQQQGEEPHTTTGRRTPYNNREKNPIQPEKKKTIQKIIWIIKIVKKKLKSAHKMDVVLYLLQVIIQ